ncbi:acetyltransferase family protein [Methyloversatilis sp. RAC08]|nr:acetyltransferase family protein [Methyloversatilis sp. RAC08]
MTPDDVSDLALIAADTSIFRYIPDIALPFDAGRWVRSVIANDAHRIKHVIRLRTGEPVGFLQLGQRRNGDLQIGYFLARAHWGNGFAREACLSVLGFLASLGDEHPVHAAVHRDNVASLRMLGSMGFRRLDSMPPRADLPPDMIDHVRPSF